MEGQLTAMASYAAHTGESLPENFVEQRRKETDRFQPEQKAFQKSSRIIPRGFRWAHQLPLEQHQVGGPSPSKSTGEGSVVSASLCIPPAAQSSPAQSSSSSKGMDPHQDLLHLWK